MIKTAIPTLLSIAMHASAAHAADVLADVAGLTVSPELIAMGIDPGVPHPTMEQPFPAQAVPQFVSTLVQQKPGPVVIIGDSIMAGLPPIPGVLNLGIGATSTAQILALEVPRIPANASLVVIEGGINDAVLGVTNTFANYQQILASIPAGAKERLIGVLPVNEPMIAQAHPGLEVFDTNAVVASINARIAPLCIGRCQPVPSPFATPLPPAVTHDGLHPNQAGNDALVHLIVSLH